MKGVLKGGRGIAVGEVHKLQGHALLIRRYTQVCKNYVDEPSVSRSFGETVIGARRKRII